MGGFLIAAAAVLVFAGVAAGGASPGRPWVVAAVPLSPGTLLAPSDLTTASMRLPSGTAAAAYRQADDLVGHTLTVAVSPGELVQRSMVGQAAGGANLRPVNLAVDPDSLTGLAIGAPVDVLATPGADSTASSGSASSPAGGSAPAVTVVVRGATLLSEGRADSDLTTGSDTSQVTLGVSSLAEVEAVVAASQSGTITLVAAEASDGVGPGPGPSGS